MKKLLSILLAVLLVAGSIMALSGCAKNAQTTFDIVLITDGATVTDKGYNQSAWQGVKEYAQAHSLSCRYYQPGLDDDGTLSVDTISKYVDLAVQNGAKQIVFPGKAFAVASYEVAPTYRDIQFILLDAMPHAQGDDTFHQQVNVMSVQFNVWQAGFLAGYTAVEDGFTKLGYLGSVENVSQQYGAGFSSGIAYAADMKSIPVILDYAMYDSPNLSYDYSVNIKPVYIDRKDAKETTFAVTVVDGIGSGVYAEGENVTITANPAPQGKAFDHWEVKSNTEGVKDKKVNISSKKDASMNLLVGDCDCTITAVWRDETTVPVTVTYGEAISLAGETVNAPVNSTVWVEAPACPIDGMVFDHWDAVDTSIIDNVKSKGIHVQVGESPITLTPVWVDASVPTFKVSVENGTGSGSYVAGDTVKLIADAPEEGKMFYKWENVDAEGNSTGIAMENEYCYHTTFAMVDRYAAVAEKMYDGGTQIIFGGGNVNSDSIFTATWNYDYPVYAFGSGIDEGSKGNCYASVVNDYGAAVKLALEDFQGGSFLSADCKNHCIYVTGKSLDATYEDKKGNTVDNPDYDEKYASVYEMLCDSAKQKLLLNYTSNNCVTLNIWEAAEEFVIDE